MVNRSDSVWVCLEVGSRNANDAVLYPDLELVFNLALNGYAHKNGRSYTSK